MDNSIHDHIAGLAAEAEETEPTTDPRTPLPEGTRVTRGHQRSKTLQIRLNGDEYEQLELIAKGRDLPVSTAARSLILAALATTDDVGSTINRIELELDSLRRAVTSRG